MRRRMNGDLVVPDGDDVPSGWWLLAALFIGLPLVGCALLIMCLAVPFKTVANVMAGLGSRCANGAAKINDKLARYRAHRIVTRGWR